MHQEVGHSLDLATHVGMCHCFEQVTATYSVTMRHTDLYVWANATKPASPTAGKVAETEPVDLHIDKLSKPNESSKSGISVAGSNSNMVAGKSRSLIP